MRNLPLGVFAPPLPPSSESRAPTLETRIGDSYELVTKRLEVPPNGPSAGEVEVLQTSRRWRGCDVYVVPGLAGTSLAADGNFWVRVYAIDDFGGRSLVASGFGAASLAGLPGGATAIAEHAAAARGIASRWMVTIQTVTTTPAVLAAPVQVVAMASDEAVEPRGHVGVRSLFCDGSTVGGELARVIPFGIQNFAYSPEIVEIQASNDLAEGAGSERYLQIHQQSAPAACVGATPLWSWPILAASPGLVLTDFRQRFGLRGSPGCIVYVSTSPTVGASAAANDAHFSVLYR